MSEAPDTETVEIGELDFDEWNEYALAHGWGDGFPLMVPTEDKVAALVGMCRGDNEPFPPMSPRRVVPTLQSIAANAAMAGCRPAYFPVVVAAVRGVLETAYNLHGTLATTHPCGPGIIVCGPIRHEIGLNCGSNCFGQGNRANAAIGRALQLTLLNVGGAKPGEMDRSTQGSPAKFSFCFGENEEESPWAPYHVRRGFAADESVITVSSSEPPHNINDHASTSGEGILRTIAGTISEPGTNNIYGKGPYTIALGPEHAETIHRDGFTIEDIQQKLYEESAVHVSRVSKEQRHHYETERDQQPINDRYYLSPSPDDIHVLVAGGPGKHSAFIPTFGATAACSVKIKSAS